jgi:hypothetical protein
MAGLMMRRRLLDELQSHRQSEHYMGDAILPAMVAVAMHWYHRSNG